MRKCVVQLRCNATILNEFSQSLEGKKISFVIACQSAHRTEVLKKITTRLGFFNSGKTKASFQISGKRPDCNELTIFVRTETFANQCGWHRVKRARFKGGVLDKLFNISN